METCFNYCEEGNGYFSSDERKWINKIRRLKEEYPDEVRIIKQPECNDGCIYAQLPASWLKVQPKRKCTLSEEQKLEYSARMKAFRAEQLANASSGMKD